MSQPDPAQRGEGRLAAGSGPGSGVEEPVGDVLQDGGVLGEEELLEDEADPRRPQSGELTVRHRVDLETGYAHRSRGGPVEGPHQVQQRRLAGPGGTDDGEQLTAGDSEADAVERGHCRPGSVRLRDALELEDGLRGAHSDGTTTRWPTASPPPVTWT